MLKTIPNPSKEGYEIKMRCPELTFEGVRGQPDFAELYMTFFPARNIIELKSLKEYFYQFRIQIFSYERLINTIYDDLMKAYEPTRLRLVMECKPRGGISSKLTIDSDWEVRGGEERFKDWVGQDDKW
jgi:7-cyano-7-deazaguanine reductase